MRKKEARRIAKVLARGDTCPPVDDKCPGDRKKFQCHEECWVQWLRETAKEKKP